MLQQAIDFLNENRLIEGDWSVVGDTATIEYNHIGLPQPLDIGLARMFGNRVAMTVAYIGEEAEDTRRHTRTFEFVDAQLNDITEFVADSINDLFVHAEEVFLRD